MRPRRSFRSFTHTSSASSSHPLHGSSPLVHQVVQTTTTTTTATTTSAPTLSLYRQRMAPSHHQRSALGGSLSPAAPPSRRPLLVFLSLLSLWLIGTVAVLSSATWFFGIPSWALLTDGDVPTWPGEAWLAPSTLADSPAVAAGSSDLDDLLDVAPSSGAADAAAAIAVAAASGAVSTEAWDGYVPGTEDWSHLNDVQLL